MDINKILKNQNGIAVFLVIMILTGVLIVSLGAIALVTQGIKMGRVQTYSTKSYFAAEAGSERILWEARKNSTDLGVASCSAGNYIYFNPPNPAVCVPVAQSDSLSNNASYSVEYKSNNPVSLQSTGDFKEVKRSVQLTFFHVVSMCKETCVANLEPNCLSAPPGSNWEAGSGLCCGGAESCYKCLDTHYWDSDINDCVEGCLGTCNAGENSVCNSGYTANATTNSSLSCCSGGCYTCDTGYEANGSICDATTNGLIAHWKLDDASGPVAGDSAMSNNGVINGAYWFDISNCMDGYCLYFDGNDYVEVAHNANYLIASGTVALWFKASDVVPNQSLWSKDSSGYDTGGHLDISINNSAVNVRLQSTTLSYNVNSGASSILSGTWYHVAFTFGSGGMQLYVDGSLADSNPYIGGLGTNSGGVGNYAPLAIGVSLGNLSDDFTIIPADLENYFTGYIDGVRFYDHGLIQEEIDALVNLGK